MELDLPNVKVKTKGQVVIPKQYRDALGIDDGDMVKVELVSGKLIYTPLQITTAPPAVKLNLKEQQALSRAQGKIETIQTDTVNSKGLTKDEADVAVKVGLIAEDQKYWWLEEWQRGEREVDRNYEKGDYVEHDNPEEFLKSLPS